MTNAELRRLRRADPGLDKMLRAFERHARMFARVRAEQDELLPQIQADAAESEATGEGDTARGRLLRQLADDLGAAMLLRDEIEITHDMEVV